MKNITQHTGILELIKRLPSSTYGNPRYLVRLAGHECRTAPNSSLAYELPNWFNKKVTGTLGTHYGLTTLKNIQK